MKKIDYSKLESIFGLPSVVKHCKKCLMTNQKPLSVNESKNKRGSKKSGMPIENDGLCAACHYSTKKDLNIDWDIREKKLLKMLDKYRRNDGRYDCIISGSGGKDSVTQAHLLKYKYGMNPLTVTYSPLLYTEVGWRNIRNWIYVGGFDNYLFTPNGKVASILSKEALINLYHPMQPFKFGIKAFAAKMAMKFDIPLVIYGEPYAEYGSEDNNATDSPSYSEDWYVNDKKNIYLGGLSSDEIKEKYKLSDIDLMPYMPIRSHEIKEHKISVEFLGWYVKWDPQEIYYYASENCGYEPNTKRTDGTYGRYSGIDEKFEWIHYYTHYIKYGIGRCRFETSQEIRNQHITRDEGILLCKRFEGEIPYTYLNDCLDFMEISENQFWKITDKYRSPHLWKKANGEWKRLQELEELT